jgi:hypothetical protein
MAYLPVGSLKRLSQELDWDMIEMTTMKIIPYSK